MAFTVEDGTGVADANSYASLAFANAFLAERGHAAWGALADSVKETHLINATDYIETRWARVFIGEMAAPAQSLSWPRTDTGDYIDVAYADDEIPLVLQRATALYAVQAMSGPLMPVPVVDDTGLTVVTTRKAVGPIEKEFRPVGSGRAKLYRSYPMPDAMVSTLLRATGHGVIR